MKKSKHFRKDVIMARIIAGMILILLIALFAFALSLFTKPSSDQNKDSQNTEHTQNVKPGTEDSENEDTEDLNTEDLSTENQTTEEQGTEVESNTEEDSDVDAESEDKIYVKTTAQIRHREEPNTDCEVLGVIAKDTKLEVLESLDGWYKVSYDGKVGYVSADYARIIEE